MQDSIKHRLGFLAAAIGAGIFIALLPTPDGLPEAGKMTLAILGFMFVMWIGRVLPNWATAFIGLLLLLVLGCIDSLTEVYESFVNSTFFFLLAAFGIAVMVRKSSLPALLLSTFVRWAGGGSVRLLAAFAFSTWLISIVMSDLAACAIVAGIVTALVKEINLPERFSRCLMILIPLSSMTGGMTTPISSAVNPMTMEILRSVNGVSIGFLEWTAFGLPVAIISELAFFGLAVLSSRPEPLLQGESELIGQKFKGAPARSSYDVKAGIILVSLIILWIAGTWVPILSPTFVALLGFIALFAPGLDMVTWKDCKAAIPWDLLLFVGSLFVFSHVMSACGTIDWLISLVLNLAPEISKTALFILLFAVLACIRGLLPGGPVMIPMVAPGIFAAGLALGAHSLALCVAMAFFAQVGAMIPVIDGQWLMTYSSGIYTTKDVLKIGIPFTCVAVIAMGLLVI